MRDVCKCLHRRLSLFCTAGCLLSVQAAATGLHRFRGRFPASHLKRCWKSWLQGWRCSERCSCGRASSGKIRENNKNKKVWRLRKNSQQISQLGSAASSRKRDQKRRSRKSVVRGKDAAVLQLEFGSQQKRQREEAPIVPTRRCKLRTRR